MSDLQDAHDEVLKLTVAGTFINQRMQRAYEAFEAVQSEARAHSEAFAEAAARYTELASQ